MSKRANPKMIGAFVIGAMGLMMAGLLAFGNSAYFAEKLEYVMYFDGDLGGLDVGAPVEYMGVKIGTVSDIKIVMDRDKNYAVHMPVMIELEPDRVTFIGTREESASPHTVMKSMIFKGLRGQLGAQSMVTGKLKIVLSMHPDTPVIRRDYANRREIPTVQSPTEILLHKLGNLKFEELMASIIRAADGIEELVKSREIKESVSSLNLALAEISTLVASMNRKLGPLAGELSDAISDVGTLSKNVDRNFETISVDFKSTMKSAIDALESANGVIVKVDDTLDENSPFRYEMVRTLKELSSAARSIRVMAQYLERHPESLISGKGR